MNREVFEAVNKVHKFFKGKGLFLSVAESCTGGLVSHYITALPGASAFFRAGIVSYSEDAKRDILGVSADTVRKSGVVSKETALEMAEKIRLLAKSDYSVSTTGNLGPDALEGKEPGLVYIAVNKQGKTMLKELRLKGDRESNKEAVSLSALKLLLELIQQGEKVECRE